MISPKSDAAAAAPPVGRPGLTKKILFSLLPLALLLLLGEAGIRLHRGRLFSLANARKIQLGLRRQAYPAAYDRRLGYIPQPNARGRDNAWGATVTIDAAGRRRNGAPPPAGKPVVAVGDSFTFGDEVSDHETWPAQLERLLRRPVLNGGVFGYGFDQIVLRAEALLERQPADLLIVSFISDDIERCELACRYSQKPYFAIVNHELRLRNVPVPQTGARPTKLKWLLGYSHLADAACSRLAPGWWSTNVKKIRVHRQGLAVAKLLLERLAALQRQRGVMVLLVVQGTLEPREKETGAKEIFLRASELDLEALDLATALRQRLRLDPQLRRRWFRRRHLSRAGNAWVAQRIAVRVRAIEARRR